MPQVLNDHYPKEFHILNHFLLEFKSCHKYLKIYQKKLPFIKTFTYEFYGKV